MHLADAFIQSDLQYIQAIHLFYQYVCSLGIEPMTFCAANAMLTIARVFWVVARWSVTVKVCVSFYCGSSVGL